MGTDPNIKQTVGQGVDQPPAVLGVLMLDTRFERWPGDIGRDEGLRRAALRRRVPGAVPREVVADPATLAASGWAARFRAAAQDLQAQGAAALTTSCGFLVLLQTELQEAVDVPLVSSALCQLPALLARQPQVGVLTIDARALGHAHLLAAGVPPHRLADVQVQGCDPGGAFARDILANRVGRDRLAAEADLVSAARQLQERVPDLGSVVLECTNMPPHAAAIVAATGWHTYALRDDARLAPYFLPSPTP